MGKERPVGSICNKARLSKSIPKPLAIDIRVTCSLENV